MGFGFARHGGQTTIEIGSGTFTVQAGGTTVFQIDSDGQVRFSGNAYAKSASGEYS